MFVKTLLVSTILASSSIAAATVVNAEPQQQRRMAYKAPEVTEINYRAAVEQIIEQLDTRYPMADKANQTIDLLKAALKDDATFELEEADFVEKVNDLLWQGAGDLHMRVRTHAEMQERYSKAGMRRAPTVRRIEAGTMGAGGALGDTKVSAEMIRDDVGLLTIDSAIYRNRDTFTNALMQLKDADHIIIDLRKVPGGTNVGVQYFVSQFFNEPTHLSSSVSRRMAEPMESWTVETPVSDIFADKKLYLLTGKRSASGAEAAAFALKNHNRATLIGEKTAGAGNAGGIAEIGSGLVFFIPMSQTINPVTGKAWEGTGVTPHVQVPADQALDKALSIIAGTA